MLEISIERLRELLSYDSETGLLTWLPRSAKGWNTRYAGKIAGANLRGYIVIKIDHVRFQAHRLIWAMERGEWPTSDVDHVDRNPSNNRISNLRIASRSQNVANSPSRKSSKSGVKGVHWDSVSQKWKAQIHFNGKKKSLGRFKSIEKAAEAYARAAEVAFGEFASAP